MLGLLVVVACAHPSTSSPCPAGSVEPAPATEDAALLRWEAIVADDARPPAGTTAAALVPELVVYLGSPDPVRRDHIAYEVLSRWIESRVLGDADVRALAARLIANLRSPVDRPASVFGRSFSALVLASIVARDAAAPVLREDERRAILVAARDYAQRELDLRGYTGAHGWAHAAAHTADLLAELAKLASFTEADRAIVLDAVASFVVRHHGEVLHDGEDDRLAEAVIVAAQRGVTPATLAAWLAPIRAAMATRMTPVFDAGRFSAQRNARNLLYTLFVRLALAHRPSDGERQLLDAVRAVLGE